MYDRKVRADIKAGNEAAGAPSPKPSRAGNAGLKRQDKSAANKQAPSKQKSAAGKRAKKRKS